MDERVIFLLILSGEECTRYEKGHYDIYMASDGFLTTVRAYDFVYLGLGNFNG